MISLMQLVYIASEPFPETSREGSRPPCGRKEREEEEKEASSGCAASHLNIWVLCF
jgi:hypothetical protein